MAEKANHSTSNEPALMRATDWLDSKLSSVLGPPPLGPYDAESPEPQWHKPCPLCGYAMGEHRSEVDHDTGHVYLHHPDASVPGVMASGKHQ